MTLEACGELRPHLKLRFKHCSGRYLRTLSAKQVLREEGAVAVR